MVNVAWLSRGELALSVNKCPKFNPSGGFCGLIVRPPSMRPVTVSVSHQLAGGGVGAGSAARAYSPARPRKVTAQRACTRRDFREPGIRDLPGEQFLAAKQFVA